LFQIKLGGGMRIEHGGVVDVLALAGQGCFYRQGLDIDVGLDEGGQVRRQAADPGRLQAVSVHQAGYFHAALARQVVDQAVVHDVAVDDARLAGFHAVDDVGAVLVGSLDVQRLLAILQRGAQPFPAGDLRLAAGEVFVQGDVELLDQIGAVALDEPGRVLAEVLAGFGDEVAQPPEHLIAHPVPGRDAIFLDDLAEARVEVFDRAVGQAALEAQVEGHVVDAGADVVDLLQRHADVAGELLGGSLDAVAQPDRLDRRGAVDRPAQDGHRVDVVQVKDVRAQLLHVAAHFQEDRDGAQAAHDPADAQRVGDGLAQAVFLGHFEVNDRAGPVAADLEHADDVVGAVQGAAAIRGGLDRGGRVEGFRHLVPDDLRRMQAVRVNVEQGNGRLRQLREAQDVAHQVLGKDRAACTNKGDLRHTVTPQLRSLRRSVFSARLSRGPGFTPSRPA